MTDALSPGTPSPFEQIRRVNNAGNPHWSSRDFAANSLPSSSLRHKNEHQRKG